MRIAFFHELHQGGARRSVSEFAKYLKRKHTVDLYTIDSIYNDKEEKNFTNIYFYQFKDRTWKGKDWKTRIYKDTIELIHLYFLHKKIGKKINNAQYDVIFVEPSRFTQAPFILRFLRGTTIYYCQESLRMVYEEIFSIPKNLDIFRFLYERLNRFIRKFVDLYNISAAHIVFANSHYTKQNIKRIYNRSADVLHMGVDVEVFRPKQVKKDIDILFVGAYEVSGGHDLFKKAVFSIVPVPTIKILASEKQWITDDMKLRDLYCRSKAVVALSYNEPFGLIPLEVMACGVPVIAVDDGGYRETILDGKTGYLVKRDHEAIAQKIGYLLAHPLTLNKLGKCARDYVVENWTWEKSSKSLEKKLYRIVSSK